MNNNEVKNTVIVDLDEYTRMIRELERLKCNTSVAEDKGRLLELQEKYRDLSYRYDNAVREVSDYKCRADGYRTRIDKYNRKSFLYRMFNKV